MIRNQVQEGELYLLHMNVMNPMYQWVLVECGGTTDTSMIVRKGFIIVFNEDSSGFSPAPMNPWSAEEIDINWNHIFNVTSANERFKDAWRSITTGIQVPPEKKILQADFVGKKKSKT